MEIVDHQHVEPALALETARPGGELGDGDAAGLVDVEGDLLHLARRLGDAVEVLFGDVAAADLVGGDLALLGDDARGELLGRHFEREEADDAAVDGLVAAVGLLAEFVGLGDVEGDVGGERRLAHAGTSGDDHEIRGLQTAHHAVEVAHARGDARQAAVALEGFRRHVHGGGESVGETLEAAVVTAGFGDRVQLALGLLDLLARTDIDRRVVGAVDDVLADQDQVAPRREVVDRATVILGVDDGRGLRRQAREILRHGDAAEVAVPQEGLQRDRRRHLAGADQLRGDVVDALVDLFGEMIRPEEIGDAIEGVVVDEDGAEQRLLRL